MEDVDRGLSRKHADALEGAIAGQDGFDVGEGAQVGEGHFDSKTDHRVITIQLTVNSESIDTRGLLY